MELEEIIAWIKIKMEENDSAVLFYKCCNDDVGAGLFHQVYIKFKKTLELLKELQERRAQPKIIYCKDCKKRNFAGYCTVHQKNVHGLAAEFWQPEDDYFCADGERKTDGNNT
jgi:hypothetical protein